MLEIGCGMGETTASIAQARPDIDFIAVDVHAPGIGSLLRHIDALALRNVRVIRHDAVDVVASMIAPHTLAGIHVFFPDPWPKKRPPQAPAPQAGLLCTRWRAACVGGYLHVATDWEDYAQEIMTTLTAEPLLENTVKDFAPRPDYRPLTKFEARGLKLGHGVWDVIFRDARTKRRSAAETSTGAKDARAGARRQDCASGCLGNRAAAGAGNEPLRRSARNIP
jgi:tRNA (guanine-N7-)-methyltransferase